MATPVTFNQFAADLHNAVHNFGSHTIKAMLTNVLPVVTNSVKADITEIAAGNGYTAGGVTLAVLSSTQTAGNYAAALDPDDDPQIVATGGPIATFQWIVVYNDTAAGKPLMQYYALPAAVTLAEGEPFTFNVGSSIRTMVANA